MTTEQQADARPAGFVADACRQAEAEPCVFDPAVIRALAAFAGIPLRDALRRTRDD